MIANGVLLFLGVASVLLSLSISWLALELRLVRCGKIAPKVLEALPDRYDTYHLDHHAGDSVRRDFA